MSWDNHKEAITQIQGAQTIAIATHLKPDGDAIGASLGLGHRLQKAGKRVSVLDLTPLPDRYHFLDAPALCADAAATCDAAFDLLIVVDAATIERTPTFVAEWATRLPIINIDHHISNTHFGSLAVIAPEASSSSEIVARISDEAGWAMSLKAAEALWVGIVTDCGRFAYSCTSPTTLTTAAALLHFPVDTAAIDHQLYQVASLRRLKLEGRAADSLQTHAEGRIASISLSRDDFADLDCQPVDADELVNLPRRLESAQAALFFYELPDEDATKVSVRTAPPHDASALCAHFGGGGHIRAAGCTISGPIETARDRFLAQAISVWFPDTDR
jgi:phosphoesterase RecJ-like protein